MAEAVVSFAVERLGELLISEIKHLHGVRDKVKEIQRELKRMQCFLKEADKKQNQDERVKNWVAEMRELAFRIEDVIETFAMEVPTKIQKSGFKKMLLRFACMLSEGVSRHNISTEIDTIKDEMANLTESLKTYGITKGLEEGETSNSAINRDSKRIFHPHMVEKDFVGMEKELKQLISALKKEDQGCEVVSICGMGGQGKTTLAQKIYNHTDIKAHFKKIAWVCITQQFETEKMLKEVLKQVIHDTRKNEVDSMGFGELFRELYQVQKENNCLVVLDDIWTFDSWKRLEAAFPVGETTSGSKILLTTRNETVAGIGHVHKIEALTTEEGWQLLSKKAGVHGRSSDPTVVSQMERIGKNMVKKCKHLPLAISSIGGILRGKSLISEWEMINKDISFYLGEGGVTKDDEYYTVRQVLGLSYDSLPPRLRHCFLCLANFKEDEVIETENLYMLWMEEGLLSVESKAEGMMLLDIAESFLDELALRSLIQVEKNVSDLSLKYTTCMVHDLIRELCLSKAKEDKFIKVVNHLQPQSEDESKARRLFINSSLRELPVSKSFDKDMISRVRSLVVLGPALPRSTREGMLPWPSKILSLENFKLLRVFRAQYFKFTKQEMEIISGLVYLKCLNLHDSDVEELPSSIGNLRNLEILDLRVSSRLKVPNVLWKLKHLKYLYFPRHGFEVVEKLEFKGLDELELIHNFGSSKCDIYELIRGKLKVLSGAIKINMMQRDIAGKSFLDFINSMEFRHLKLFVECRAGINLVPWLECPFINVLTICGSVSRLPKEYDPIRFSSSCLSKLTFFNCKMEEDPMISLEKLPNLSYLQFQFSEYSGTEMVCTAKGFPKLEELSFESFEGLKQWRVEEGAMPNLSFLEVDDCTELEMLPERMSNLISQQHISRANFSRAEYFF